MESLACPLGLLTCLPDDQTFGVNHQNNINPRPWNPSLIPDFDFTTYTNFTLSSGSGKIRRSDNHPCHKWKYSCQHNWSCPSPRSDPEIDDQEPVLSWKTYIFPTPQPTPSRSVNRTSTTHDTCPLESLAASFHTTKSQSESTEHQSQTGLTSLDISSLLLPWRNDASFMSTSRRYERNNSFPGIDMNHGWNRAKFDMRMAMGEEEVNFPVLRGGVEEKMRVLGRMAGFSWARHREGWRFEGTEGARTFAVVFVSEVVGRCGWVREPGSWWGAGSRKGLLMTCRGRIFIDDIDDRVADIKAKVHSWMVTQHLSPKSHNKTHTSTSLSLKRAFPAASSLGASLFGPAYHISKRLQTKGRRGYQVMSEEWRKHRREQERKAGRWLDGTMRMWRVWEAFHWVLDEDDPRDVIRERDGRRVSLKTEVCGRDIWG
jgi:hypothetical protein